MRSKHDIYKQAVHARRRWRRAIKKGPATKQLKALEKAETDVIDAKLKTTRYAVVIPCDNTHLFLTHDDHYTTHHPDAHLFSDFDAADAKMRTIPARDYDLDDAPFVELVVCEAEFRSRPDTWTPVTHVSSSM